MIKLKKIFRLLFVILLLFFIYLLFFPRKSFDIKAIYEPTSQKESINFGKEIVQEFCSEVNYLTRLDIYINSSLNNIELSLSDENDKIIYKEKFEKVYNIVNFVIPTIDNSLNKKYKLIITSEEDIKIDTQSNINNNYIIGYNDKSIVMTTIGYKNNRSDLWYPLFATALLFTIYSMLEDKNEKK